MCFSLKKKKKKKTFISVPSLQKSATATLQQNHQLKPLFVPFINTAIAEVAPDAMQNAKVIQPGYRFATNYLFSSLNFPGVQRSKYVTRWSLLILTFQFNFLANFWSVLLKSNQTIYK